MRISHKQQILADKIRLDLINGDHENALRQFKILSGWTFVKIAAETGISATFSLRGMTSVRTKRMPSYALNEILAHCDYICDLLPEWSDGAGIAVTANDDILPPDLISHNIFPRCTFLLAETIDEKTGKDIIYCRFSSWSSKVDILEKDIGVEKLIDIWRLKAANAYAAMRKLDQI